MILREYISTIMEANPYKMIISNPTAGSSYKRIVIAFKDSYYQAEKYTEKQVFHENISGTELADFCEKLLADSFKQLNAWTSDNEYSIRLTKKGKPMFSKVGSKNAPEKDTAHNRKKNYILEEGTIIPPLVDMNIFTGTGQVRNSMQDKYRQINRFVEIIDDYISQKDYKELTVIDFGCGKSYLTFVLYYYFTEIKHISVKMIGLDLKDDVIKKCNAAAKKYGYDGLSFELGDINGYKCDFPVDMVITLHACDTATDYALYNAITWNTDMIFSVPCCQHELNAQIKSDELSLITRYGIIKERASALFTDAIRANLLEYCGYKTQLLEFIDFEHTPKNILIRAKRTTLPVTVRNKALAEVHRLVDEFNLEPTLLKLIEDSKK
ncbi:MAG: SAM-dependent methyltransferase [Lachnospiraceae bacterium]|nr:SAM-dependent methyltransferase [Lachnospiraceae bacterium]